jgi:hypothetical protein
MGEHCGVLFGDCCVHFCVDTTVVDRQILNFDIYHCNNRCRREKNYIYQNIFFSYFLTITLVVRRVDC